MERLADNATQDVLHVLDLRTTNVQDVQRDSFWMLQQTVLGQQSETLILFVEQIVIKMLLDGTTFWQATIVPMWDPTDHLNLETIGLIRMSLSVCFAIRIALYVLVIL